MNIDRIKKAADAVKWHRRSDLLDSLLTAIDEELGPIGACKSNHLTSLDERQDPSPDVVTISRKEWDWLKLRSRRCLAWDQWAQEEMTEIPDALRAIDPPPRQVIEAPELTDSELDSVYRECQSLGTHYHEIHRSRLRAVIALAFSRVRFVPTPPQPAPGAVIKVEEFRREDRYVVLKRTDLERYATPAQLRELERTCEMVRAGRMTEGKRLNSYVVVADDWPEYKETWAKIQARVTGAPHPLHPEERRVGPDEVVVGREEWVCMLDLVLCLLIDEDAYDKTERFLGSIERARKVRDGDGWIGVMADELDTLRTSAQAHATVALGQFRGAIKVSEAQLAAFSRHFAPRKERISNG